MAIRIDDYAGPTWWPLAVLKDLPSHAGLRRVAALWVVAVALSLGLAWLEAVRQWSGIPIHLPGLTLSFTIYLPLTVALLLAVWLGPAWGLVAGYAAGLLSAALGGIGGWLALVFALATPVEVMIVWGAMVLLEIDADVRRPRDVGMLLVVGLVAAGASSLAGLIWIQEHRLDVLASQRIWQGWITGDFVQMGFLLPLLLRFAGPPMRGWIDRQLPVPPRLTLSYTRASLLTFGIVVVLAVMVAHGVSLILGTLQDHPLLSSGGSAELLLRLREVFAFMGLLLLVAVVTTMAFAMALARMSERDRSAAQRDPLTGVLNRRALPLLYRREADRSRRLARGVALLFFDLDRFKEINDRFGHEVGDEALRLVARRVQGVLREHDVVFRWGGEEFLVLLPHTTLPEAETVAERLRLAVAGDPLRHPWIPEPLHLTVSVGLCAADPPPGDVETLIQRADAACLRAKELGRNRVALDAPAAAPRLVAR